MTEHTPGPWTWGGSGGEVVLMGGDPDQTFILRTNHHSMRYISLSAADKALIETAPALLAECELARQALEAIAQETQGLWSTNAPRARSIERWVASAISGLDAAIAKAQGVTQ